MSQQPPPDPNQRLNIDDASIQGSQVGQAGRDLTQIQMRVYGFPGLACLLTLLRRLGLIKSLTEQDYLDYRRVLLNKVRSDWIKGLLEGSLQHVKVLIELALEERLDAIERPFTGMQELSEETRKPLPPGTSMTQVFDQMGAGRTLLILGEPGSGKTITLLKLAQSLIARTEADLSQPIPVVFHLSAWVNEQQTIADWLVQELSDRYDIPLALGKVWVEEQQLLLLLDGLDEVRAKKRREACVQALNRFKQAHGRTEIVICSRVRDYYEILPTRLRLQRSICIQPLTLEHINQYLEQAGKQLAAIRTLLQEDTVLQELVQSPLMLSVMSLAYQGASVAELPRMGSLEDRRYYVFNAYIKRMFKHEKFGRPKEYNPPYSPKLTVRRLTWLAQRMIQEPQTIFLIERMQPSWLESGAQKWIYHVGVGLISMLIFWLISFSCLSIGRLNSNPLDWSVLALVIGLRCALQKRIKPIETLGFSWRNALSSFTGVLIPMVKGWAAYLLLSGLVSGLFILIRDLIIGQLTVPIPTLFIVIAAIIGILFVLGVTAGSTILLANSLGISLRGSDIPNEERKTANQGIWQSFYNVFRVALISTLTLSLVLVPIRWLLRLIFIPIGLPISPLKNWLVLALILGLSVGLLFPGLACIQYLALRLILCFSGSIPWNYARFLKYATERIFLQPVGSGYTCHYLLLEHFAQRIEN